MLVVAGARLGLAQAPEHVRPPDDGKRAVNVERYGIRVRVPQAWRLIVWGRDNQAFALRVPQDTKGSVGQVRCELGVAPETLTEYRERDAAEAAQPPTVPGKRTLLENRVEPVDAARFGLELARSLGNRQASLWEIESPTGDKSFEMRTRVVSFGTLYTFTLATDEAHYEAYRLDFDEMLTSAKFTPPETGLQRLAGGMWMQRDFRFALRLPLGWQPAFSPSDRVLFYATGPKNGAGGENLVVQASLPRPLDLERLKETLPLEIAKQDPAAKVTVRIVPQGTTFALETRIHSQPAGKPAQVTLERRFRSRLRNYELRFTCHAADFEQFEPELLKALDSFSEVVEASVPGAA
jgi:hypothetical protein